MLLGLRLLSELLAVFGISVRRAKRQSHHRWKQCQNWKWNAAHTVFPLLPQEARQRRRRHSERKSQSKSFIGKMCWLAHKLVPSYRVMDIDARVARNEIMKTKRGPTWITMLLLAGAQTENANGDRKKQKKQHVNWDWWVKYYVTTSGCQRRWSISPIMVYYSAFRFHQLKVAPISAHRLPKYIVNQAIY